MNDYIEGNSGLIFQPCDFAEANFLLWLALSLDHGGLWPFIEHVEAEEGDQDAVDEGWCHPVPELFEGKLRRGVHVQARYVLLRLSGCDGFF